MRYFYVIGKPLTKQSMLTIWLEPMSLLSYSEILINTMKEAQIKTMVTVRVRKQNMIRVPFVVIWFVFADLRGKVIRCSYPCSCKFYSAVQSIFLLYRRKCFSSRLLKINGWVEDDQHLMYLFNTLAIPKSPSCTVPSLVKKMFYLDHIKCTVCKAIHFCQGQILLFREIPVIWCPCGGFFDHAHVWVPDKSVQTNSRSTHKNTADGKETLLCLQFPYTEWLIWFSKSYMLSLSKCWWLTWSSENKTPLWELIFLKRSPPSQ